MTAICKWMRDRETGKAVKVKEIVGGEDGFIRFGNYDVDGEIPIARVSERFDLLDDPSKPEDVEFLLNAMIAAGEAGVGLYDCGSFHVGVSRKNGAGHYPHEVDFHWYSEVKSLKDLNPSVLPSKEDASEQQDAKPQSGMRWGIPISVVLWIIIFGAIYFVEQDTYDMTQRVRADVAIASKIPSSYDRAVALNNIANTAYRELSSTLGGFHIFILHRGPSFSEEELDGIRGMVKQNLLRAAEERDWRATYAVLTQSPLFLAMDDSYWASLEQSALEWTDSVSVTGLAQANAMKGFQYLRGINSPVNYRIAIKHLLRAQESSHVEHLLSEAYAAGGDTAKAYQWELLADSVCPDSSGASLEDRLSRDEIARAQDWAMKLRNGKNANKGLVLFCLTNRVEFPPTM